MYYLIKVGAKASSHARRWYVLMVLAFLAAYYYRAVLAGLLCLAIPEEFGHEGFGRSGL